MNGYDLIKQLAADTGLPVPELIALSRNNDPFYSGSPAQIRQAEWFHEQWIGLGYEGQAGIHLRRMHYRLVSQDPPPDIDGETYANTDQHWQKLLNASKAARYQQLVPADAFIDQRNPDPVINFPSYGMPNRPSIGFDELACWSLPRIETDLRAPEWTIPEPELCGFGYSDAMQPVVTEVWIEKSTQNDWLLPLSRRYQTNLVTGAGFSSITGAISALRRAAELRERVGEKPVRIFYLSDFDPAGDKMPVATARQLEFWLERFAPGADICLTPLALTREQVERYDLPRIPIKESDRRAAGFELRNGHGAVELDAMEALHPGVLQRIVQDAIAPYRDPELKRRIEEAAADVADEVADAWHIESADLRIALGEIRTEVDAELAPFEARLKELQVDLATVVKPFCARLEDVRHGIQALIEGFDFQIPPLPEPEIDPPERRWMFDSARSYFEQLDAYRRSP